MRISSRIVCKNGEHTGVTGTIIDVLNEVKPYYIEFDDLTTEKCGKDDIIEIDDITNCGNIRFEKYMRIYDKQFNMVGQVVDIKELDKMPIHVVKWQNGSVSEFSLNEEFNYIVVE